MSDEPTAEIVTSGPLIRVMWARYADEARAAINLADGHCDGFGARRLLTPEQLNTTSREDCAFLCLLIRHFGRRHVFEVGTNIGTSAACMNAAVRRNGGVLTTSDPIDYKGISPWSGIRFIHGPANIALYALKAEGHRPDFCFLDWLPDVETFALMAEVLAEDAILAAHDFNAHDIKGREVVTAIERAGLAQGRVWLLPSIAPDLMEDGTRINNCTAVCVPRHLLPE